MLKRAIAHFSETEREFIMLRDTVMSEMKDTLFLFVPSHVASYYERDDLVSEEVIGKFPKASEEIRNAGSCLAAGLNTACVFHAMRAAEIGVRALGNDLEIKIKSGKPIELAEWREILDGFNTAIQKIENLPNTTSNKDQDLLFYSEACAQFRFFKNGWRIRVAHARASYTEPQANETIDQTLPGHRPLRVRERIPENTRIAPDRQPCVSGSSAWEWTSSVFWPS